jgi:cardiolipin synthase A/B
MSDQTPSLFVTTGSYPTRFGNTAQLLIDGEPAFRRVCEAIEMAKHSIWVTVTFMWSAFRMPDGRGTTLEVLNHAAKRGVDVRLIFWRPDDETATHRRNAFWGAPEHFELLERLQPQVNIRWDRAEPGFCQHQKTWLIDAGEDEQTAFLGGINLNPNSMVAPGHFGEGQNHDVYIELTGAAVADVHHNFVQRWNEASERDLEDGCWGARADHDLEFPNQLPLERGEASVQIQRTIHAGRYKNGHAPVNAKSFDIALGETTTFAQYCALIRAAQHSIYIENQYLETLEIVEALLEALERGVEVVLLMPVLPDLLPTDLAPERQAFLECRAALGAYDHFTLAGIAGLGEDGLRKPVWIHSKLMLVDGIWATIGSANLHRWSMFGNAELNATIFSADVVQGFRIELFKEHLALDTSELDEVAALHLFKRIADANQVCLLRGDYAWQGLAVALDIATYGKKSPFGW